MQVIGIVNITENEVAYSTTFFTKELYTYAISNGLQIPEIIVYNISDLQNKSSAYANELQYISIVDVLGEALELLISSSVDKVAILCNVAHLYVGRIISKFPDVEHYFIDIVKGAVINAQNAHIKNVLVFCSENARKSKLFDNYFGDVGVSISYAKNDQNIIHSIISAVENNCIDDNIIIQLYDLCSKYRNYTMYFACTELSLIYGKNRAIFADFKIIDTWDCAIQQLFID